MINKIVFFLFLGAFHTFGICQQIKDGVYVNTDSLKSKPMTKTSVYIQKDSIIMYVKNLNNIFSRNKQLIYRGTFHKTKNSYVAIVTLMSCDTCPVEKWQCELENPESYHMIFSEKIDTTILNGDTTFSQPAISGVYSPISADRQRMLIIKVLDNGSLKIGSKFYKPMR